MRRPLKPFVTEYKTSSRRQQSGSTEAPAPVLSHSSGPEARSSYDAESSYEAALRAADALFSGGSRPAADAPADPSDESAPAKPGGRILRVLDEPPPPEFAALEAAYAPKRRGRKPGSKNKPKTPAIETVVEAAAAADAPLAVKPPPAVARGAEAPRTPTVARRATAQVARAGKRFSWTRDTLGPGEDWKRRRLPRICW